MKALIRRSIDELRASQAPIPEGERDEGLAFLDWLAADRFVFLGARTYEYPRDAKGGYAAQEPLFQPEGSLGVLRDPERMVLRRGSEPAVLSAQLRRQIETGGPLTVAKSNLTQPGAPAHPHGLHRRAPLRSPTASPLARSASSGLFTAEAYDQEPIPTSR
jgi:glutamate dehydrogenase